MKRFRDEKEVFRLPDSRFKRTMMERIAATHATCDGLECDIVADCGGDFLLLDVGDDPKAIALYEGGEPVDLTDFEERCFEYVELSEDGMVFELYLVTGDEGGPSIFVPNEPWIGTEFRRALTKQSGTVPREAESDHQTNGGEDA